MNLRQLLIEEIDYNYAVADKLMMHVDDGALDWKPETGANWMTTGQLIKHTATCCGSTFRGFVTGDWGMPDGFDPTDMKPEDMLQPAEAMPASESVAVARKELAEDQKLTMQMLEQVTDEDLENKPAPAPWDPRPMLLGQRLLAMVLHLMQHKGQLFYYLKLQDKPVNTTDLWGM